MIKINLLPVKLKKKPKAIPPFVVAAILLVVLSGVGCAYAVFYYNSQVEELEREKAANALKIQELEKKIKEVRDFEALNKKFQQRRKIIEQLTMNQSIPVKILDEMSNRLTDGIWLTNMSISGKNISLAGVGFSNTDIVSFVQHLKASKMFTGVLLQGTTRVKGKVETFNFTISLKVK